MFLTMLSAQIAAVMCLAVAIAFYERNNRLSDYFYHAMCYALYIASGATVLGGIYHLVRWIGN